MQGHLFIEVDTVPTNCVGHKRDTGIGNVSYTISGKINLDINVKRQYTFSPNGLLRLLRLFGVFE